MKVKLDDVVLALEFIHSRMDCSVYYNDKTGEFIYIGDYTNIALEDYEDIYDDYICLPTKDYIGEYEMMEEFIETIESANIYNELEMSILGKGAFRRFYSTINRYGLEKKWDKFRDEKYKKIAVEWCKKNKIDFE